LKTIQDVVGLVISKREMLICFSAVPERIEKTLWWILPRKLMRLGRDLSANGQYKRN
jgi:hypothetical protein